MLDDSRSILYRLHMDDSPAATLRRWLDATGTTQTKLARRLGVTVAHVGHWLHGRQRPGLDLAAALERVTGRAVRAVDWAEKIDVGEE